MEASPPRPLGTSAEGPARAGSSDRKNKVQRIGSQTRGLFEDFTSWVELRLRLFQVDVQDRIRKKVDEAIIKAAPVAVGLLGGFFALVTAALFIGWALGHPAWGFLIVTGLLFLTTGALYARSRRLADKREVEITGTSTNGAGTT